MNILNTYSQQEVISDSVQNINSVNVYYFDIPGYIHRENNELQGLEYELILNYHKYIEEKLHKKIPLQFIPNDSFSSLYNNSKKGRNTDLFIGGFSITDKRLEEVNFSPSYMADITVLVSSLNLPIVKDTIEFVQKFKDVKGLGIAGTTLEKNILNIKQRYLPMMEIVQVDKAEKLWSRLNSEDNYITFVQLDNYLLRLKQGFHLRRQRILQNTELGRGFIFPKNSLHKELMNNFFAEAATKQLIEKLIIKYFGTGAQELLEKINNKTDTQSHEIDLLTKERNMNQDKVIQTELSLNQRNILVAIATFALLLSIGLLIFVYRRYRSEQATLKLIQEKNSEIAVQNEELQQQQEEIISQRDALTKTNTELNIYRNRIGQSIRAAQSIQNAILPTEKQLNEYFDETFIIYLPKDVVSGDFYWFESIDDKLIFIEADCTGHGVSGAFMTIIGNAILNQVVRENRIFSPVQIMTELHKQIQIILQQEENNNFYGMDISIVVIEKTDETTKVTFGGAGQKLYYITPQNQLHSISGSRKKIGGTTKKTSKKIFEEQTFNCPKGTVLYLGSDGYVDQNNSERKSFGSNKFVDLIQKNQNLSLYEQKEEFISTLQIHQKNSDQRDDITVIALKL
ncbi:SpoIIE family protein phosphatase [Bernardetia litoralis]|uniref:SpoIIE family protein phosphatase n=1 Tax=Bernardetia litoralis TaxID=999 RepID=UPI00145EC833|nr:SpoIIE family protein phosphatase [Bernardetia litoralis]